MLKVIFLAEAAFLQTRYSDGVEAFNKFVRCGGASARKVRKAVLGGQSVQTLIERAGRMYHTLVRNFEFVTEVSRSGVQVRDSFSQKIKAGKRMLAVCEQRPFNYRQEHPYNLAAL